LLSELKAKIIQIILLAVNKKSPKFQ